MIFVLGPESYEVRGFLRAYGPFTHPNQLAIYLELTTPIFLALLVGPRGSRRLDGPWYITRRLWPIWLIGVLAGLFGLVLSQSRGGMVGMAAGFAIVLALIVPHVRLTIVRLAPVGLIGALAFLTISIGIVAAGVETFSNRETLVTPANFAVQERLSHWTTAVEMAKEHPFVGVGAGNFDFNYRDYTQEWRFRIGRGHAHDTYLHFLAQSGVVGLTAYIAVLLGVSLIIVRTIRILPGGSRLALLIGAAGITAATGAHAVFEYVHVLSLNLQLVVVWAMAIAIGTDAWNAREQRCDLGTEVIRAQQGLPLDPDPASHSDRPIGDPSSLGKGLLRPRTIISFALAIAIMVFFFQRLDLDLAAVADNIRSADLLMLAAAIVVYVGTIVVRAVRWRWMLAVAGAGTLEGTTIPPVGYLTAVLLVSWFFNCILPAKLGRRLPDLSHQGRRWHSLFDRIRHRSHRACDRPDRAGADAVGFGSYCVSRQYAIGRDQSPLCGRRVEPARDGRTGVHLVLPRLIERRLPLRFRNQWQTLTGVGLRQFATSTGTDRAQCDHLVDGSVRLFLVAKALDVHISFELAIFVGLMAALLTTLPFTPAGLGVVEVATVSVLKLVDVPVDLAGSVALLDRLITYWGLIAVGALVYLYMLKWGVRGRQRFTTAAERWTTILIDVSAAINQGAGIGRYARELTRELIPLLPAGKSRIWFAADAKVADAGLLDRAPWSSLPTSRARLSRRNIDRMARFERLRSGNVLGSGSPLDSYSPDFTSPPGRREHVTVHDLAWHHPEAEVPAALTSYLRQVVDVAVRNASTIFTVSRTIRTEILNRFDLPETRVIIAPNAPAKQFFSAHCMGSEELATFGIDRSFLLFVGTIEPRKNLPIVLEAMLRLPDDLMLVIAGGSGARATEQLARIKENGLNRRVVRLGFIPEIALPSLYASASVVVYPSLYEGFGLPVVEGLATGVPVVASDLPVFHEVGGQEVTYFDPFDALSLVHAIEITTGSNSQDEVSRERRRAQARMFEWRASAQIVARAIAGVSVIHVSIESTLVPGVSDRA